jgi:hypothetical protein
VIALGLYTHLTTAAASQCVCAASYALSHLFLLLLLLLLQALAQVDNYLRSMGVVKEAVDDTAGAAQMVSQQKLQVSSHTSCMAKLTSGCRRCRRAKGKAPCSSSSSSN